MVLRCRTHRNSFRIRKWTQKIKDLKHVIFTFEDPSLKTRYCARFYSITSFAITSFVY